MSWKTCTTAIRPSTEFFFFFNDTATTEVYTLSRHDALPISHARRGRGRLRGRRHGGLEALAGGHGVGDRNSTRLNSSHGYISYAVFCLKKKKKTHTMSYICKEIKYLRSHECERVEE